MTKPSSKPQKKPQGRPPAGPQSQQRRKPPPRPAPARTKATVSEAKRAHRPRRTSSRSLAQQRKVKLWLLLAVLVVANVAVALVWRDWAASLAAGIGSVIVAPLLAALLLRRR